MTRLIPGEWVDAAHERTILIAEDEAQVRAMLKLGLEMEGYQIITAEDGIQALAVLKSDQAIDLLLSDIVMPGGFSGIDLARDCRRLRPTLPVLLITGYAHGLMERLGSRRGEFQIMSKPCAIGDLAAKIGSMLGAGQAA